MSMWFKFASSVHQADQADWKIHTAQETGSTAEQRREKSKKY